MTFEGHIAGEAEAKRVHTDPNCTTDIVSAMPPMPETNPRSVIRRADVRLTERGEGIRKCRPKRTRQRMGDGTSCKENIKRRAREGGLTSPLLRHDMAQAMRHRRRQRGPKGRGVGVVDGNTRRCGGRDGGAAMT